MTCAFLEDLNGDRLYCYTSYLTASGAATIPGAVYNPGGGYVSIGTTGTSYGPLNLRFRLGGSSQALVTGTTLSGTSRNDVTAWVGLKLVVGSTPITVTDVGRWVRSGNGGNHTVKLVSSGGTHIIGGAATVATSGKTAGTFAYASLGTPITLAANATYFLVTEESLDGDQWYDYTSYLTSSSGAAIASAAYNIGGGYVSIGGGGNSYGPVSIRYRTGSATTPTSETRYLYLGRLAIQERDGSNTPQVSYTRGWDLSSSFEGAGGIGGLLARTAASSHLAYHADGSGNITALIDTANSVSTYRYDPYGNVLSSSGTAAAANTYRFSSKEFHASSGLYYYGFRFYEPQFQRWLTLDPRGENGGINLYAFAENSPALRIDPFGLKFEYYGRYADDYRKAIECWKTFPKDSPLKQLVDELDKSSRSIRITELKEGKHGRKPITRPATVPDIFDSGKGHDTTTYIDPKGYTYDGRTWTFKEALAHELLHARDNQDPQKIGRGHGDEDFKAEEKQLTSEAENKCGK